MAVLAQRDADEQAAGEREVENPFGSLAAYLANLLRSHQEAPELMRLWVELAVAASRPDHPAHAYFVRRYETTVRTAELAYEQARADGVLRPGVEPAAAARQFVALMDGLQIQWLLGHRRLDMAAILRAHLQAQLTVPPATDPPSA